MLKTFGKLKHVTVTVGFKVYHTRNLILLSDICPALQGYVHFYNNKRSCQLNEVYQA